MRSKYSYLAAFLTLLLAVTNGCVPSWKAVFINLSNQRLQISVFQTGAETPLRTFTLKPGQSHESQIALGTLVVSNDSATELFQKPITIKDADEKYHRAGKREIHFILNEKGAYPIPLKYWNSWREHLTEILPSGSVTAQPSNQSERKWK